VKPYGQFLKKLTVSTVRYKVKDDKSEFNLEEEFEFELLEKITIRLFNSKSGKTSPETKSMLHHEDMKNKSYIY
jgi:aromatic ring-cleaving dioxygenase